jgi:hypothetical protein
MNLPVPPMARTARWQSRAPIGRSRTAARLPSIAADAVWSDQRDKVLRRGLSLLATTICTAEGAPASAGIRLRAGRAGSGKAPPRW